MSSKIIHGVNVVKEFDGTRVVDGIDFWVKPEEFLTILGPSGCGKTTTLRMIGGFETPTSGQILFDGKDITQIPPYQRQINTVFQRYALFPHMNIYENIAFGLRIKKVPEAEIKNRVEKMLKLVELNGFQNRSVRSLSGGQQQRIAIARALANEPKVLLLDEPLGALDLKLRKEMQYELKSMQQELGITFIYVTHDQEEALTMSDKIIIMNDGRIQQIGSPTDIYNEPENAFVADFIGESNIIDGIMHEDFMVSFAGSTFTCVDSGFGKDEPVDVVIRPEDILLTKPEDGMIQGVVDNVIFKGVHYEMIVMQGQTEWMIHSTDMVEEGSDVGMRFDPDEIHIMKKVKTNA
ncbi:spermidine/putrescine ABC transporter ATP-binding protein [Fusibacter sp. JL216-2]|uniref:spermidine/putrescine ABC transporter ATP-binding protein n=1 Tax=Fusibacter sp. JL216-2 TaxID=3071453 RepID=UPI003D33668C